MPANVAMAAAASTGSGSGDSGGGDGDGGGGDVEGSQFRLSSGGDKSRCARAREWRRRGADGERASSTVERKKNLDQGAASKRAFFLRQRRRRPFRRSYESGGGTAIAADVFGLLCGCRRRALVIFSRRQNEARVGRREKKNGLRLSSGSFFFFVKIFDGGAQCFSRLCLSHLF